MLASLLLLNLAPSAILSVIVFGEAEPPKVFRRSKPCLARLFSLIASHQSPAFARGYCGQAGNQALTAANAESDEASGLLLAEL